MKTIVTSRLYLVVVTVYDWNTLRCEVRAEVKETLGDLNMQSDCKFIVNPLMPNDNHSGRTAPLTSKCCILYIYSTNIGTEYFKHGIYSPFFLFKMPFVS